MPKLVETKGEDLLAPEDAITSAVGSMAAHFLRENLEKGRDLSIPSYNVILHADGTASPIDPTKPVSDAINPDILRPR